jgi:hypothetical protein
MLQKDWADPDAADLSVVGDHLYPIEAYWGLNPTKRFWVPLALTDAALLSSILFCGHQFKARMNGQQERASAIKHLTRTVRILNERFQKSCLEIGDSTIAAVAGLALTEVSSSVIRVQVC